MNLDTSYFPYKFREDQDKLFKFVQEKIRYKNLVISAPTGYGKTSVVLAALLPYAKENDLKILWSVRTGPETDRPIEELKKISSLESLKGKVYGVSIRGKKDMCLLKKELSGELDYEDVAFFCRNMIKNKSCDYYNRLNYVYVPYQDEPLLYTEILKLGEKYRICPYYYQLYQIIDADVISVNYNYIFNEYISWSLKNKMDFRSTILVVDEAHNLQFLLSSLNNKEISLSTVKNAAKEIEEYEITDKEVKEFLSLLENLLSKVLVYLKSKEKEDISLPYKKIVEKCNIKDESIFEKIVQLGAKVRLKKLRENKSPRSSLYRLGDFFLTAKEIANIEGVEILASIKKDNLYLEIFDMRTKEVFANIWNKFHRVVLLSGTLGSIEQFSEIIGLENYEGTYHWYKPNPKLHLSIITNFITTKGETLSKEMAMQYVNSIEKFVEALNENIAVFCASYRIIDDLIENGLIEKIKEKNRKIFVEQQDMEASEAKKVMDEFKRAAYENKGVLIASASGRFAEGADFPEKELEGVFLVGIPFDRLTTKTFLLIKYYRKVFGKSKGRFYAYTLPALRRASHAIGRAIRSPEDKAVFILGDRRYKNYMKFLPNFARYNLKYARNEEDIYKFVKGFY